MRFAWGFVLLAGCGSPVALESPAPPVTRDRVQEGGTSTETKPPKTESLKSCTLDLRSPFGGTSPGWRRETFDAKGHPRAAAAMSLGFAVSYGEYMYDDRGRVVTAPMIQAPAEFFSYGDGDRLEVSAGSGSYSVWDLDAAGRVVHQRNTTGAGEILATYEYDSAGRLVSNASPSGPTTVSYAYDDRGFLSRESLVYAPPPTYECHRDWVWTHGPVEMVEVQDESGHSTQRCTYAFDDDDRLVSAKCTYSSAIWQYDGDTVTMSLGQGASVSNIEQLHGDCDAPLTRETFARNFVVPSPDPRPSNDVFTRLRATLVPQPYKECGSSGPFGGE